MVSRPTSPAAYGYASSSSSSSCDGPFETIRIYLQTVDEPTAKASNSSPLALEDSQVSSMDEILTDNLVPPPEIPPKHPRRLLKLENEKRAVWPASLSQTPRKASYTPLPKSRPSLCTKLRNLLHLKKKKKKN
ncbi:uncharacterized protein F4822DRAFT_430439 [Hypoxylon trugodes]|uniref:uncharacterized protein n=1 Tax=Hypoxylon trugodes TaxID=326681 RepID=UPI0021913011|nr:uncharacterized protein F4822DRAFT_430439 [Hypoxylon trugodes]KAI1387692.1 hypothetical protein F4822DRAFT_430439 [Hypoxylon trugodes]